MSLNCNLKLVLVGNVGFFRGIVGKVLTLSNPLLSRCYLTQLPGRSYENLHYYFYTYLFKVLCPYYTIRDTTRKELFSNPIWPLALNLQKNAVSGENRLLQNRINTRNSNGIVLRYGWGTCSQKITVEKRD